MNKSMLALLPGSYDTITLGHMDVIRRAAAMFDSVAVAVMTNEAKCDQYMFSMEQRRAMAVAACAELSNVRVVSSHAMLIELFDELGADVVIKGVRNETDYAYEQTQALWNRAHNPRVETLYFPADSRFDTVSSTLVRERLAKGESIDDLVPPIVAKMIAKG